MATTPLSDTSPAAIRQAIATLEPYSDQFPDLLADLRRLDRKQPEGDYESELAKSMIECERISKSEGLPEVTRERARAAGLRLQAQHLARVNPRAAREWVRVQSGVAA